MKYEVEFGETAEREAEEAYAWIAERGPEAAARWFNELERRVQSLSALAKRCPLAPESVAFEQEIRQLLFGHYRVLFAIRGRTVYVLHVRHTARETLEPPTGSGLGHE